MPNGGADGVLCQPCDGSIFLAYLPLIIMGVVALLALTYVLASHCGCGKTGILASLRRTAAYQRLQTLRNRAEQTLSDTSVAIKILISLWQMLRSLGVVFDIKFPEEYVAMLRWIGSLIEFDLPNAMPLGCLVSTGFFTVLAVFFPAGRGCRRRTWARLCSNRCSQVRPARRSRRLLGRCSSLRTQRLPDRSGCRS